MQYNIQKNIKTTINHKKQKIFSDIIEFGTPNAYYRVETQTKKQKKQHKLKNFCLKTEYN